MVEYGEITAIRRATRLVRESEGVNFSFLNAIVYIVMVVLVIAGVISVLKG